MRGRADSEAKAGGSMLRKKREIMAAKEGSK